MLRALRPQGYAVDLGSKSAAQMAASSVRPNGGFDGYEDASGQGYGHVGQQEDNWGKDWDNGPSGAASAGNGRSSGFAGFGGEGEGGGAFV